MKNRKIKLVIEFSILCVLFIVIQPQNINAQVSQETAQLLRSIGIQILDKPLASRNFNLQLLTGGNAGLEAFRGNVIFLNFWATWCPPCRDEMPSMENLYQRYKDRGLVILAVDLQENANTVRQFIQSYRLSFPVLLDLDGRVGNNYNIQAIPATYIIDRQGRIIGSKRGSMEWDTPQVFAAFEALLESR
jgi:thiol-disulfide isomerase/thioredoxin